MRRFGLLSLASLVFALGLGVTACGPRSPSLTPPAPTPTVPASVPTATAARKSSPAAPSTIPPAKSRAPITPASASGIRALDEWHVSEIMGLAWAPDSSRLALVTHYGIDIYDPVTKTNTPFKSGEVLQYHDAAFAPDGTRILTTGDTTQIWTSAGRLLSTLCEADCGCREANEYLSKAAWSPSGELVAVARTSEPGDAPPSANVYVWNLETGTCLGKVAALPSEISSLGFDPSGRYLVASPYWGEIVVWSAPGIADPCLPDNRLGRFAQFVRASGDLVFSGDQLTTWSFTECRATVAPGPDAVALDFSPTGELYSVGYWVEDPDPVTYSGIGAFELWDIGANSPLVRFEDHPYSVELLSFSPDGAYLASGNHRPNLNDGVATIIIWGMP